MYPGELALIHLNNFANTESFAQQGEQTKLLSNCFDW